PAPVSELVMKLLAKAPEERYQTASGVEHDLRRCLAGWQAARGVGEFPLGARDRPERLLIPERLYGREGEIARMHASFDEVAEGRGPLLVLVHGRSGIGKSSVVNELHKALVPSRGVFASGKFDKLKSDAPYGAAARAIAGLVRRLLGRPDAEL